MEEEICLFFYAATFSVLIAAYLKPLKPLLGYGKTIEICSSTDNEEEDDEENSKRRRNNLKNLYIKFLEKNAAYISKFTVPKRWFTHFYIIGCLLSTLILGGYLLCDNNNNNNNENFQYCSIYSISYSQPGHVLTASLLAIQMFRRLYECIFIEKNNPKSKMLLVHYIAGIGFYICIHFAIWVPYQQTSPPSSIRRIISTFVFLIASIRQYNMHCYLASLKTYVLPDMGSFQVVACPHYTAEVVIYGSLAAICPSRPMALGFLWVLVNLSVSASQSLEYYTKKYGNVESAPKFAILPGFF